MNNYHMFIIFHIIINFYILKYLCQSTNHSVNVNTKTQIYQKFLNGIKAVKSVNDCGRNISIDINTCVDRIFTKWISDEDSDGRDMCCAIWDSLRCIKYHTFHCESIDREQILSIIKAIKHDAEENDCQHYKHGSSSCHFPLWAVLVIVLSGFLFVIIVVSGIFYYLYRNRKQFRYI